MRDALSNFLASHAEADPNFYVLSGDHGYALFNDLRARRPKQFINAGVSEQAMVGYAAGMTKFGLRTVVYGLAAFIPIRVVEFIKYDICYDNLPVLFLGDGAGLVYNPLGASHQAAEDIAVLRSLPNITIYSPADKFELEGCLDHAIRQTGPTYLRIGKSDKPKIHRAIPNLAEPDLLKIKAGTSLTAIVATGSMVSTALTLAETLNVSVFSAPILTGLNRKKVMGHLAKYENLISLEEHSVRGGLGSILAETLTSDSGSSKTLRRLGLGGQFTQKCGSYEYGIAEHGLDVPTLAALIRPTIS